MTKYAKIVEVPSLDIWRVYVSRTPRHSFWDNAYTFDTEYEARAWCRRNNTKILGHYSNGDLHAHTS
jgi:hypothetical protein